MSPILRCATATARFRSAFAGAAVDGFDICLERLAILFQSAFQIVLCAASVADLALRNCQIAQPLSLAGSRAMSFSAIASPLSIMFDRFLDFSRPAVTDRPDGFG